MATKGKTPPAGTIPVPDNPRLVHFQNREKQLVKKLASLEDHSHDEWERKGFNLLETRRKTEEALANTRKQISLLSK